jgi:hypothetical protein
MNRTNAIERVTATDCSIGIQRLSRRSTIYNFSYDGRRKFLAIA